MLELGPFQANVNKDKITLSRGSGSLQLNAGDLSIVSKLISMALEYCAGRALPPFLQWNKFEVRFAEDGDHILDRIGEDNGIVITQEDGDILISLLSSCLSSHVDSIRLTGGPRRGARPSVPDPIVIGRE